jgi:hypothetical protein
MKNEHKDIFKYLEDNNLGTCSLYIRIIENRDLNDPNTLTQLKEIIERYEDSPNKYPEDMMIQLRQRIGLNEYDTSNDEEINSMSKDEVFENLLGWNGLIGWDYTIKEWIKQIYNVELE